MTMAAKPAAQSDTRTIIDFPKATLTTAHGINTRGDISGYYRDGAGRTHGYLLRRCDFTSIDFPDATLTRVLGIK
jgi:hypothetical protein